MLYVNYISIFKKKRGKKDMRYIVRIKYTKLDDGFSERGGMFFSRMFLRFTHVVACVSIHYITFTT